MTNVTPADPTQGLSREELLKLVKPSLKSLIDEQIDQDIDPERVRMMLEAREANLYWKGDQYHALALEGNEVNFSGIGSPYSSLNVDDLGEDTEKYDTTVNHYRGFGKKFVSLIGSAPPSIHIEPDNPEDEAASENAEQAESTIRVFEAWWNRTRLHRRICLGLWKSNTMFGYVQHLADAARFGTRKEPEYAYNEQEIVPAGRECPQCGDRTPDPTGGQDPLQPQPPADPLAESETPLPGLEASVPGPTSDEPIVEDSTAAPLPADLAGSEPPPEPLPPSTDIICRSCGAPLSPDTYRPAVTSQVPTQSGVKEYPNSRTDLTVFDILSVTVPNEATSVDDCPWLRLDREQHKAKLLSYGAANGWSRELLDKIRKSEASTGETPGQTQANVARRERESPSSLRYPRKGLLTTVEYWITNDMLELINDEEHRQALKDHFPRGLRVVKVLDDIAELKDEALVDHWDSCAPDTSDTIHADPVGKDFIPIQDQYNDSINIGQETLNRQLPQAIGDPRVVDFAKLNSRSFRPNEIIPGRENATSNLKEGIAPLPKAEMSDQHIPFNKQLLEDGKVITGMVDTLWGGQGQTKTAHEAEMLKAQGLQGLGIPWDELRGFWERISMKALKLTVKYGASIEIAPGDARSGMPATPIDFMTLNVEGIHAKSEEAFPVSWSQKRDQLNMDLQSPNAPVLISMMGYDHPLNAPLIKDLRGLPGLTMPNYDLAIYAMSRIRELLKSPPIQQPQLAPDPVTGQMIPTGGVELVPSIQPDPFIERNHQFFAELIRGWCASAAGRRQAKANAEGFENVKAYGQAHEMALQQEQMAQQAAAQPPQDAKGSKGGTQDSGADAPNVGDVPPTSSPSPLPPEGSGPPGGSPGVNGPEGGTALLA